MKRLSISTIALLAALPATAQDIALDEIIVSANREETTAGRTGASVVVLTAEDLAKSGERSVANYFRSIAGVTIQTRGTIGTQSTFLIRGASQNYIGSYVDGIDVTDPSGPQVAFDLGQMTTIGLGRIEILKGSQSALYGAGAVGGVVSFTTARPEEDGFHQSVQAEAGSFNTQSAAYTATFRDDKTEAALTLGHMRTDGFSNASARLGNTEADGFESTRLSFYVARTLESGAKIGMNGFWEESAAAYDPAYYLDGALLGTRILGTAVDFVGTDDILIPLGDGSSSDEELARRTLGLRGFAEFSTGAVDHKLGVSTFNTKRRNYESEVAPDYGDYSDNGTPADFSDDTYGTIVQTTDATYVGRRLKADWAAAFDLGRGRMNIGAEWAKESLVQFGSYGSADSATFTKSLFAEYTAQIGSQTDVALSGRVDRHSLFGNLGSVRFAMAHRLGDDTVLRLQAGTGFRAPSNFELFSFYGATTLKPEESTNLDFGIEHSYASGARVKATAFYLDATNLIDYDVAATGCPAAALYGPGCYAQVAGHSIRKGLELEGKAVIFGDLSVSGAYTYTDSRKNASTSWAQVAQHRVSVSVEKPLAPNLIGRLGVVSEFDRPDWSDGTPAKDYAIANAMLEYDFGNATVGYLRVENLLDEDYELSKNYGTAGRSVYLGINAKF
jgi:vitamin B12 transporter